MRATDSALKAKVIAARAVYRATLDLCGRGDEAAYRAMEAAEEEWDAEAEAETGGAE